MIKKPPRPKILSPQYLQNLKQVLIVYNQPDKNLDEEEKLTEQDTLDEVNQVKKTLNSVGINSSIFGLTEKNIGALFKTKADFIFNLCYGIGSKPDSEKEVFNIFEKMAIPYTGGPREAVVLTNNKTRTKELLMKNKLATPKFISAVSLNDLRNISLNYPLITKTQDLGCSMGMDQNSVVKDFESLKLKVNLLLRKYKKTVLIEEFIDGREFSVFILGNGINLKIFPPVETVFGPIFAQEKRWKIFDFEAKWLQDSEYCKQTPYVSPTDIDKKLEKQIFDKSLKAYHLSGCNDYARLDLRVDKKNNAFILEINLNPSIGHGSQIETGVKAAGLTFSDLIFEIIIAALKRYYKQR